MEQIILASAGWTWGVVVGRFRTALFTTAAIGFASIASAADMPTKAPPKAPVAASATWTDCYVGGNIGGDWNRISFFDPIAMISHGPANGSGVVGGGHAGCDYQFNSFVVGIQGMFDGSSIDGSGPNPILGGTLRNFDRVPWFATLTGRIGYIVLPSTSIYAKGGAAWVENKGGTTVIATGALNTLANYTANGWTLGGGVEYMFAPHWSVFAEYDYMDFGTTRVTATFAVAPLPPFPGNLTQNVQTTIVGVNYRF